MPRTSITLNGIAYPLALEGNGAPRWAWFVRASQRGDPATLEWAEWQVDGPHFFSVEDIQLGRGYLGVDYGENTDSRWRGLNTLGPQISMIDLGALGGGIAWEEAGLAWEAVTLHWEGFGKGETAAVAATAAVIEANGTTYAYVGRGDRPGKIDLSDMTARASMPGVSEAAATDLIATRADNSGTDASEIGYAQGASHGYRTLNEGDIGAGGFDTWRQASPAAERWGQAHDRVVRMAGREVSGNVLSGAVTMQNPNWQTVATIRGPKFSFTGFTMDGSLWVLHTSNGPYLLDAGSGAFFPLIEEIVNDAANGRGARTWFALGSIFPMRSGLRYQRSGSGASIGPEVFEGNTSPVQGTPKAGDGSTRWWYQPLHNPDADVHYLLAGRPRRSDDQHPHAMSWYVIARLPDGMACDFVRFIGSAGGMRTNDTVLGGYGSDAFWFGVGRRAREIDDPNYRFATAGTTFYTELRRDPGIVKDLEAVEFIAEDATTAETITIGFSLDGRPPRFLDGALNRVPSHWEDIGTAWEALDTYWEALGGPTLNGKVISPGWQRLLFVDDNQHPLPWASGRRIKPVSVYASSDSLHAPKLVGPLRLQYRARPERVRVFRFTLDVTQTQPRTAAEVQAQLASEWERGPIPVADDPNGERYYIRVESVEVALTGDRGGGADGVRGQRFLASVTGTEWSTSP